MPKATIIADMKYKRRGEHGNLRELLKYLQYRDGSVRRDAYLSADPNAEFRYPEGVSDYIRPTHRDTRWVDRGMGETYTQIANAADDLQGRSVLARTWVISPDPDLMRHVPEDKRFELVQRVTEGTIERWYSDNGWGTPEYSFVVHDKHRSSDGEQMAHAHVITPAIDTMIDALANGEELHVRSLGRFWVEELPPRRVVSNLPHTETEYHTTPRQQVRFRASSATLQIKTKGESSACKEVTHI